jgi:hypothetical protein
MCLLNVKHMESDMTKREKNLQLLRNRILRLEKIRDQALRDLVIAETRLPTLRKQAMRLRDRVLVRELRAQQAAPATQVESPHRLDPVAVPAEVRDELLPMPTEGKAQDGRSQDNDVVLQNDAGAKGRAGDPDEHGGIPTFLRRGQAAQAAADAAISEAARKLAALPDPRAPERKAVRKEVEKQVREAELTGKRRKLPLTGKQALAEINRQR